MPRPGPDGIGIFPTRSESTINRGKRPTAFALGWERKEFPTLLLGNEKGWRTAIESLHLLGVGGQAFAVDLEVILIHHQRASIHEGGHRRCQRGAPVFELVYCVVMQVVEEF